MLSKLNFDGLPNLIMLVGIPASGKSTLTDALLEKGCEIISSDKIREELCPDVISLFKDKTRFKEVNAQVFDCVHERAIAGLKNGKSVVLDATNLSRKKRVRFLSSIKRIECNKICILMITPVDTCLERNRKRTGSALVGEEAMYNMLCAFECPHFCEGWDQIIPYATNEKYTFPMEETKDFDQSNPHHTSTLYNHLLRTQEFAIANGYSKRLCEIALYHDIGKLYTKRFENRKGEKTEIAHYLGHENYGAYLYLVQECCGKSLTDEELCEVLYRTTLINLHMRPYHVWRDSPNAKARDLSLLGKELFDDVALLSWADRHAH